jgi:hypothetical protein
VAGEAKQVPGKVQVPQGLLYVAVDCPPELETEFHAWYNLEHIPERLGIPGFVAAQRYAALEGGPRWVAAYALDSVAVLDSPEYLRWSGPNFTPWTKRIVSNTCVHRSVFRLARGAEAPGAAGTADAMTGLVAVRYQASSAEQEKLNVWHDREFCAALLQVSGVKVVRRYENAEEGQDQLLLYSLESPWVVQEPSFARVWQAGWAGRGDALSTFRRTLYVRIR